MAKPDHQRAPSHATLTRSIEACIANGDRLLDDSLHLQFEEPPASRLVLAVLAQEEFAKAFLLLLVRESVIGWDAYLLRAMNDHACKHLVGTIIEYVHPPWDESYGETMERIRKKSRSATTCHPVSRTPFPFLDMKESGAGNRVLGIGRNRRTMTWVL